jgi:putative transposase
MVAAPFADFTWRHARRVVAESDREVTETEIARTLDALLTRAEHGPDTAGRKVAPAPVSGRPAIAHHPQSRNRLWTTRTRPGRGIATTPRWPR